MYKVGFKFFPKTTSDPKAYQWNLQNDKYVLKRKMEYKDKAFSTHERQTTSQQSQLPTMGRVPGVVSGTNSASIAKLGLMDMSTGMRIDDAKKRMGVSRKLLYRQAILKGSVPLAQPQHYNLWAYGVPGQVAFQKQVHGLVTGPMELSALI